MLPRVHRPPAKYSSSWPMKAPLPLDSVSPLEFPRLCRAVVIELHSCVCPWNATYPPHVWHSYHRVHSHASLGTRERRHTQPRSPRTRRSCRDPAGRKSLLRFLRRTHTNNRLSVAGVWLKPFSLPPQSPGTNSLGHHPRICCKAYSVNVKQELVASQPRSVWRQRTSFSASCGQRSGLGCPSGEVCAAALARCVSVDQMSRNIVR